LPSRSRSNCWNKGVRLPRRYIDICFIRQPICPSITHNASCMRDLHLARDPFSNSSVCVCVCMCVNRKACQEYNNLLPAH
jgi:hypothetical protein